MPAQVTPAAAAGGATQGSGGEAVATSGGDAGEAGAQAAAGTSGGNGPTGIFLGGSGGASGGGVGGQSVGNGGSLAVGGGGGADTGGAAMGGASGLGGTSGSGGATGGTGSATEIETFGCNHESGFDPQDSWMLLNFNLHVGVLSRPLNEYSIRYWMPTDTLDDKSWAVWTGSVPTDGTPAPKYAVGLTANQIDLFTKDLMEITPGCTLPLPKLDPRIVWTEYAFAVSPSYVEFRFLEDKSVPPGGQLWLAHLVTTRNHTQYPGGLFWTQHWSWMGYVPAKAESWAPLGTCPAGTRPTPRMGSLEGWAYPQLQRVYKVTVHRNGELIAGEPPPDAANAGPAVVRP